MLIYSKYLRVLDKNWSELYCDTYLYSTVIHIVGLLFVCFHFPPIPGTATSFVRCYYFGNLIFLFLFLFPPTPNERYSLVGLIAQKSMAIDGLCVFILHLFNTSTYLIFSMQYNMCGWGAMLQNVKTYICN